VLKHNGSTQHLNVLLINTTERTIMTTPGTGVSCAASGILTYPNKGNPLSLYSTASTFGVVGAVLLLLLVSS